MPEDLSQVPKSLIITVQTPEKILFEGECAAVAGLNVIGPFSVMPGHQNFISNVTGTVTVHKVLYKDTVDFQVQVGVIRVKLNKVQLYIILTPEEAAATEIK